MGAFSGHPIGTALAVGSAGVLVLMFVLTGPLGRLMTDYAKLRGVGEGGGGVRDATAGRAVADPAAAK